MDGKESIQTEHRCAHRGALHRDEGQRNSPTDRALCARLHISKDLGCDAQDVRVDKFQDIRAALQALRTLAWNGRRLRAQHAYVRLSAQFKHQGPWETVSLSLCLGPHLRQPTVCVNIHGANIFYLTMNSNNPYVLNFA